MTGLVAILALQGLALVNGAQSYEQAFKETEKTGRPLVVLIGADWCTACRTMKFETVPGVVRNGGFKRVSFAVVNSDDDPTLASQLMRGESMPQLVMFTKSDAGWSRTQMIGGATEEQIREFIDKGLEIHVTLKPVSDASTKN